MRRSIKALAVFAIAVLPAACSSGVAGPQPTPEPNPFAPGIEEVASLQEQAGMPAPRLVRSAPAHLVGRHASRTSGPAA